MKTLVKNMLIVAIAMICNIANAQESIVTFKDSTEYQNNINKGLIVPGENLELDLDYMDLADQFGSKAWDAKIKKGVGIGTIITGWYIGLDASAISDVENISVSPQASFIAGHYFGWGDIDVKVGMIKDMEFLGAKFDALSSSLGIGFTIAHFGNRQSVDKTGLTPAQIKRAVRNEKYSRTWRIYAEARVGYQYAFKKTEYTSNDNTATYTGTKDGSSVSYGAALGLEKRFVNKLSRIGIKAGVQSFQFKSNAETYQPVQGYVSVYWKFGIGRRPNGGKF